jgi:hypothetical protein
MLLAQGVDRALAAERGGDAIGHGPREGGVVAVGVADDDDRG